MGGRNEGKKAWEITCLPWSTLPHYLTVWLLCTMASASLAVVAFLAVVATAVSQSMRQNSEDQNTWNAMVRVKPSCENTYNNVVAPFFANDPACKEQVEKALKTYNKAECPVTTPTSFVWTCMSGWNGSRADSNRVNAWRSFLMNCEILYIAQRIDTGESEDGFVFRENSCFPRFPDMGEFVKWLSNPTSAAAGLATNAVTVFFSALLAVFALRLF